ncbi:hypothetical protein [Caulobacter soli]|uniref:hypothetical protein n=1 Tax=Caulobacter soli TaxID=2708539 RepID=UPI0013EC2089|nr:hypothetical protein [Caulobacter soli]
MSEAAWPDGSVSARPDWYAECFRNALRRVAATLNSKPPHDRCRSAKLARSDDELAALFVKNDWDKDLIRFHPTQRDAFTTNNDQFQAEYFFYCDVDFPHTAKTRVARFVVPEPFLDWGYAKLTPPRGSDVELGLADFGGDSTSPSFVRHCATNYLVKNFWHNFVHRALQGITTANYRDFGGYAREDSDFEADHVANLLLLRAYGLPVLSGGRISPENAAKITALFARNRCNLIFAERARLREDDRAAMSVEQRWDELEWRFCRGVSNAVSMALLAKGLAAPSVRVFLTGEIRRKDNDKGPNLWRDGVVIVDVGGLRINTTLPPYVPIDELQAELSSGQIAPERRLAMRALRADREREIVGAAVTAYAAAIRNDASLREATATMLAALWTRLKITA